MKKSLKKINPDKIAQLELCMWQAYYDHKFFKLFLLLLKMMRESFGLNYFSSLHAAYYAAFAATDFRLNKGKENSKRVLKKLTKFYKIVLNHSLDEFDSKRAAELELEWWFVDRYPSRYKISREEAIAVAMAIIYNVDSVKLMEYAKYRAQAMVLHDEAKLSRKAVDWDKIGSLLKLSFNSLSKNIQ